MNQTQKKTCTSLSADDDIILLEIDYAFKKVMHNPVALKGLLSVILDIDESEIKNIVYLDPFTEKERAQDKLSVLDLYIEMSNDLLINIEMQVIKENYWNNRNLTYMCKKFGRQLESGQDYSDELVKPFVSISILDFINMPEEPSFYNHYQLMNPKTRAIYSDKLNIHMIELPKLNTATEEEKQSKLYRWCRMFRAKTWEEYESIAKGDNAMETAVKELKGISKSYIEQLGYINREMALADEKTREYEQKKTEEARRKAEEKINATVSQLHENILQSLEALGTVSESLRCVIESETELSILVNWITVAAKAKSIEEFEACIK